MNSLRPKDYQTLPRLDAPAAYICVVRDIESDSYRIESVRHPAPYIATLVSEASPRFGIELLAILQTDDLAQAESELYSRYHARLSDDWFALDPYQIETLRQSQFQIDAFASQYLLPQAQPARLPSRGPRGRLHSSLSERRYGLSGLRSQRSALSERRYGASVLHSQSQEATSNAPHNLSLFWRLAHQIDKLFAVHPGFMICIFLLLLLLALFVIATVSLHSY